MEHLLQGNEEQENPARQSNQAVWFFAHLVLAVGSWLALMIVGSVVNPSGVPQFFILLLSTFVPFAVGFAVNSKRQDEIATAVWLIGLVWILIVSLWVLDMPTGPNACFQCDATEKLARTFFSLPKPSGLIDNDGPFLGTWPAAALIGYAIGARFAMKKKTQA